MIGIDVGGANVKVVDDRGAHIHYCPLWKGAPLADLIRQYRVSGENAAVVMSGELADCFNDKAEGIRFIVDVVRSVFPDAVFYGTDGRFHDRAVPGLAAANWLASADLLRDRYPGAVFVDIGSTTTDIIPLGNFGALKGLTDLLRLQKGYLIYTGMLRTNVSCMVRSVSLEGVPTPVSSEYFACSADVHLVLGHILPKDYTIDTPDGGNRDVGAALRRLARVVCADLDEIGREGATRIAREFWDQQRELVCSGIRNACSQSGEGPVVCAGIGGNLFARVLGGIDLSTDLGTVSDALPAYAVREVWIRDHSS